MGATIVHSGVKLDNLVQVAHNDEIGSHTVMAAQVGIIRFRKVSQIVYVWQSSGYDPDTSTSETKK